MLDVFASLGDLEPWGVVRGVASDDFDGIVTALFKGAGNGPGVGTRVGGGGNDGGDGVQVIGVGTRTQSEGDDRTVGGSPIGMWLVRF